MICSFKLCKYILVPVIFLLHAISLPAWYIYPATLSEAVDQAQLIFVGTVAEKVSALLKSEHGGFPATCFILNVDRVLKGETPANLVTIRILGGLVINKKTGEKLRIDIGGSPDFTAGESYLLFLKDRKEQNEYRIPIYDHGIELVEYAGRENQYFLANNYGSKASVIEDIVEGEFVRSSREIIKIIDNRPRPTTYEYDPELIREAEPMATAESVLVKLRDLIAARQSEPTFVPGESFTVRSVSDLRRFYSEESLAEFTSLDGCGER